MSRLHATGPKRRAFSLIEMLAVIGVLGLLVTLLIPAIQAARGSARRTRCVNNMKQAGVALHSYHETHGVLPPGLMHYIGDGIAETIQPDGSIGQNGPKRSCWMQQLLPHLEQSALYETFPLDENVESRHWGRSPHFAPIWTVVPTLVCPSDPASPKVVTDRGTTPEDSEGFHGNIVMCAGNSDFGLGGQGMVTGEGAGDDLNGMFYALSSTVFAGVRDGASQTAMGSEIILTRDVPGSVDFNDNGDRRRDTRGRYYNCYWGETLFSTQFPPNTSVPDENRHCENPNPHAPCNNRADIIAIYARSYHPGGANVLMADGAVNFVSDFIDVELFRALGSRDGSEFVGEF